MQNGQICAPAQLQHTSHRHIHYNSDLITADNNVSTLLIESVPQAGTCRQAVVHCNCRRHTHSRILDIDESRSRLKPSSAREDQSQCMTDQHGYDESLSLGPRHDRNLENNKRNLDTSISGNSAKTKVPMPDEQLNPLQILRSRCASLHHIRSLKRALSKPKKLTREPFGSGPIGFKKGHSDTPENCIH